jgi:hypothetical protein
MDIEQIVRMNDRFNQGGWNEVESYLALGDPLSASLDALLNNDRSICARGSLLAILVHKVHLAHNDPLSAMNFARDIMTRLRTAESGPSVDHAHLLVHFHSTLVIFRDSNNVSHAEIDRAIGELLEFAEELHRGSKAHARKLIAHLRREDQ